MNGLPKKVCDNCKSLMPSGNCIRYHFKPNNTDSKCCGTFEYAVKTEICSNGYVKSLNKKIDKLESKKRKTMSPKCIDSVTVSGNKVIVVIKCNSDETYKKTLLLTAQELYNLIEKGVLIPVDEE